MSSATKNFILIAFIALILRLAMFLIVFEHPERAIVRDSQSYLIPAINIVDGHGFSSRVQPPFTASANRTPGYPLFIATLYALFGRNVVVIAFVQVLIDTVSTILTYYLGLRLVSNKAAFLGALGYALSLGPAIYAVLIMTETLFTLCLLGAIITFTRYRDRNQVRWLVGGGLLIGIAVLIRPIALFFPLAALLLIWVDPLTRGRRFLTNGAVFLVTVAAVVAPWVLRNYRTIGLATVSTISSYNLLYFNAVSLDADLHGVSQADARATMHAQVEEVLIQKGWVDDEFQSAQLYVNMGREIILSNPGRYIVLHLKNDANSLLPSVTFFLELLGITQGVKGTLSVLNQAGLLAAVDHYFEGQAWLLWAVLPLLTLLGLIYIGALLGITALLRQRRWYSLLVLLLPVVYFITLPGAASNPRFRLPIMPYICLLAGTGLAFIIDSYRRRGHSETGKLIVEQQ